MPEESKRSLSEARKKAMVELRKTVSTSLATAFGLVIALLWNNVVSGGLKVAGVDTTFQNISLAGWAGYLVTAIVLTVVMIVFIVLIGRWGASKEKPA